MFAFIYRDYCSSKVLRRPFRYFPCRLSDGVWWQSLRRLLSLCYFGAKLQAKFPAAAHIALRLIRDVHCGLVSFDLSVFPHRKSLRICSFCAPYCAFAGRELQALRSNRAVNFTTPRCIIWMNIIVSRNKTGEISCLSPQYMTFTCVNMAFLTAFCRVKVKSPQSWICKVKRKTALKQRRKRNFRRTFSLNIANL